MPASSGYAVVVSFGSDCRSRARRGNAASHTLDELAGVEDPASILAHGVIGKELSDYSRIFAILRASGYDGWVSIEDGMNGLSELRESAEFLRQMMLS